MRLRAGPSLRPRCGLPHVLGELPRSMHRCVRRWRVRFLILYGVPRGLSDMMVVSRCQATRVGSNAGRAVRSANKGESRRRVMSVTTSRFPRALPALLLVAAQAAGLLAPVEMQPAEAAFPGDNGVIAFVSKR